MLAFTAQVGKLGCGVQGFRQAFGAAAFAVVRVPPEAKHENPTFLRSYLVLR